MELIKKLAGAWKELPASQKQVRLYPFPEYFELYRWWGFIWLGVLCFSLFSLVDLLVGWFLKGLKKHVRTVGRVGSFE